MKAAVTLRRLGASQQVMLRALPPIQLLVTFEAVARLSSMRLAAAEAFVTPSAVSQQVKLLEDQLGLALVKRDGRGVALTREGHAIARWAGDVVAAYRGGHEHARALLGSPVVRISATDFMSHEVLIPGLARFHAVHAGIDLRLETSMEHANLELEPIDAAVRVGNAPFEGLEAIELERCEAAIVGSPEMARRMPLRRACDLNEHTLIHATDRRRDWARVAECAGLSELRPRRDIFVDGYLASLRAAERGFGIAIALLPMTQPWLDDQRLVLMTDTVPADVGHYFVFRKENPKAAVLHAVACWVKSELERASATPATTRMSSVRTPVSRPRRPRAARAGRAA